MVKQNIILIGMPGCGKSTTGQLLANKLNMNFCDTDDLLRKRVNRPLKQIVAEEGRDKFLKLQENTILSADFSNSVISTGGSVVCSRDSMNHLRTKGIVVYLYVELVEIKKRLGPDRKLARGKNQSIEDMYLEREPLYSSYADITIRCCNLTPEQVCDLILNKLEEW